MAGRRVIFTAVFALGSIMAGAGWIAEWRGLAIDLKWAVLFGHLLQVVGIFGLLLIPDRIEIIEDDDERE